MPSVEIMVFWHTEKTASYHVGLSYVHHHFCTLLMRVQ